MVTRIDSSRSGRQDHRVTYKDRSAKQLGNEDVVQAGTNEYITIERERRFRDCISSTELSAQH